MKFGAGTARPRFECLSKGTWGRAVPTPVFFFYEADSIAARAAPNAPAYSPSSAGTKTA